MCQDKKQDWTLKYPDGMFVIYYLERRDIWLAEQHLSKPNAWTQHLKQWDNLGQRTNGSISDTRRAILPQSRDKKKKKVFTNKIDFIRECDKLHIDVSNLKE